MTIQKIEDTAPQLNQYCFIRVQDEWVFCIYQGKEEDHKWGFWKNPSEWVLDKIQEWQPANLSLSNPTLDLKNKKVTMDLIDVHNGEHSMYDVFLKSIYQEENNDDTSSDRIDGDIKE